MSAAIRSACWLAFAGLAGAGAFAQPPDDPRPITAPADLQRLTHRFEQAMKALGTEAALIDFTRENCPPGG